MPAITDWVRARNASITVGGNSLKAMTCRVNRAAGRVDRSYLGNPWFQGTTDIITVDIDMTLAVSAAEGVPDLQIGEFYDATYATTGGLSHSGKVCIESVSESGGARGGYDISIRGFFTDTVTTS